MKQPTRKSRHKLDISAENSDVLLGLVTAEADYKISLILNNLLDLRLAGINPVDIFDEHNEKTQFSRFSYSPDYKDIIYYLISNRSNHIPLNKKFPNIDYFLFIKDIDLQSEIDETILKIRSLGEITAVFQLEYDLQMEETVLV